MEFYTRSLFGCKIKMCCATCVYKAIDRGGIRICRHGYGSVKKDFHCNEFDLDARYMNAGKGTGKVKYKTYLKRINDNLDEEGRISREKIQEIRNMFNNKIYMKL